MTDYCAYEKENKIWRMDNSNYISFASFTERLKDGKFVNFQVKLLPDITNEIYIGRYHTTLWLNNINNLKKILLGLYYEEILSV